MVKKYETSLDYRKLADQLWAMAREAEDAGLYDKASILKGMSDTVHDKARLKAEEEQLLKNSN